MVELGGGRYALTERLGGGGMGDVWGAEDRQLERPVAIKLLQSRHMASQDMLSRFLREVKITARLEHENVVRVYDSGWDEPDGQRVMYLVMERLSGVSLRERMAGEGAGGDRALPVADVIRWGRHVCRALEAAHARGLVHRDLKPANVQITDAGKAVLLDFGIACFQEDGEGRTQITPVGWVVGTRGYMSPEQSRGDRVGTASDLYSLGCLLYAMLTGGPPFTDGDVLWQHQNTVPMRPGVRRDDLEAPWELDDLVMDLLKKDPGSRPASAAEVYQRLEDVAARRERKREQSRAADPETPPVQVVPVVREAGTGTPSWAEHVFRADLPDWLADPEADAEAPPSPVRAPRSKTPPAAAEPPASLAEVRARLAVRYEITGGALVAGLGTFGLLLGAGGIGAGASAVWGLLVSVVVLVIGVAVQYEVVDPDEVGGGVVALLWLPALIGGIWLLEARADFRWYYDIAIGFGISVAVFVLGVFAGGVGETEGASKGLGPQAVLSTLLLAGLGCVVFAVHLQFAWWTALLSGFGAGAGGLLLTALLCRAAND
ncbi:serine/threonine-protein kinase [Streptomyces plumbiresistens]|uniref:non-specific serine/threonine protein kinase n=1 Tax=Streptomyces plumbiresistens TaxID=511811 RepID=A0ABP7QE51_9ACTN